MSAVRVLVVDDSVVARRMIADALARCPGLEVAGIASDGSIALTRIEELSPDAVVLDIEMPKMDGLATLEAIRKTRPDLPVVMFSTLTEHGARATLDALDKGASDYVTKPSALRGETVAGVVQMILAPKLLALAKARARARSAQQAPSPATPPIVSSVPPPTLSRPFVRARVQEPIRAVVIASSTGGPTALAEVIPRFPADFPLPVLVVQHMPPVFTKCLAERLGMQSELQVREAQANEPVRPGAVLIAPGGQHLEVAHEGDAIVTRLTDAPPENSCRPAADVLFRSAAKVYRGGLLAVVMTGMGKDGFAGTADILAAGGRSIAQSGPTCTVWGMPRAVEQAGLADQIVPLSELTAAIVNTVARFGALFAGEHRSGRA